MSGFGLACNPKVASSISGKRHINFPQPAFARGCLLASFALLVLSFFGSQQAWLRHFRATNGRTWDRHSRIALRARAATEVGTAQLEDVADVLDNLVSFQLPKTLKRVLARRCLQQVLAAVNNGCCSLELRGVLGIELSKQQLSKPTLAKATSAVEREISVPVLRIEQKTQLVSQALEVLFYERPALFKTVLEGDATFLRTHGQRTLHGIRVTDSQTWWSNELKSRIIFPQLVGGQDRGHVAHAVDVLSYALVQQVPPAILRELQGAGGVNDVEDFLVDHIIESTPVFLEEKQKLNVVKQLVEVWFEMARGPIQIHFQNVSWLPAIAGAGDNGRSVTKEVLRCASWTLKGPEKLGLIGANGCGKSTQLLMIQGLVEPTSGRVVTCPPGIRVAYMKQEADLDDRMSVAEELRSVFSDRSLDAIDADLARTAAEATDVSLAEMDVLLAERAVAEQHSEIVDITIRRLGLADWRESSISELSGGWQMRVALGKIILSEPELILLDEPTNHVDLATVEFMEGILQQLGIAMVIASHDRHFLNRVCTKIVDTYRGKTEQYNGNYVDYLRARDESLAAEWRKYQRYTEEIAALKKQITLLQDRLIEDQAALKRDALERLLAAPVPRPEVNEISGFRFPSLAWESVTDSPGVPFAAEDILFDCEGLRVAYGDAVVLDGISFSIRRGDKVALVGRNGCGKSTLLRVAVGQVEETADIEGDVFLTDAGTAYFPQRLAELLNYETASVKNKLYTMCGVDYIDAAGGLDVVLKRLRLDGVAQDQPVQTLSGGEKARVAFARFLLQPCALLVFDEPTNHLDIPTRELLEDALKAFDGAALVVSHDRYFLREFATRVVEIVDGKAYDHASWDEYAKSAPAQERKLQSAEQAFLEQDGRAHEIWSKKKMARLIKRYSNVGLRRLKQNKGLKSVDK